MAPSAFISYSSLDSPVAEALCEALEAGGTQCWIAPRDISPSKEWAEEIIDGINIARLMLLVLSSHSNGSPQVRREIERAIHKEIPVIVFRIENIEPTRSLEYFLSSQHWFDAFGEPVQAYLPRLCRLVEKLCQSRPESPAPAAASAASSTGNPHAERFPTSPPPAPAAAPAPTSAPARIGFAEADLSLLEAQLATRIGPIARLLVRKAAARSNDHQSLLDALANELDSPVERAAFITACRHRLGR